MKALKVLDYCFHEGETSPAVDSFSTGRSSPRARCILVGQLISCLQTETAALLETFKDITGRPDASEYRCQCRCSPGQTDCTYALCLGAPPAPPRSPPEGSLLAAHPRYSALGGKIVRLKANQQLGKSLVKAVIQHLECLQKAPPAARVIALQVLGRNLSAVGAGVFPCLGKDRSISPCCF